MWDIKFIVLTVSFILISPQCFAAKDAQSYDDYLTQKKDLSKAILLYYQNNPSEALPVFEQLKHDLNPAGEYYYAEALLSGEGVERDEVEAKRMFETIFPKIKSFAKKGDDIAQFILAEMYSFGRGTEADDSAALKWCRKAADQGNACAQAKLGLLYETGLGTKKNTEEALKWYRQAAEHGQPEGQFKLGSLLYRLGNREALKWYRKAAEQNNVSAQYALATIYDIGDWVQMDLNEALIWYRKAAKQGDKKAERALKRKYQSVGFDDIAIAEKWLADGLTLKDMGDWGPAFTPAEVKNWSRIGLDKLEVDDCKKGGYSPKDISELTKIGTDIRNIKLICGSLTKAQKREWETEFKLEESIAWFQYFTFEEAVMWKKAGYSQEKAKKWVNMGVKSPVVATRLNYVCPKGFEPIESLIQANPYDVEGKCYYFVGQTKQILSKSTALYSVAGQTFYLDFGKGSAPKIYFEGIVKGVGVYTYSTVLGAAQQVPNLKAVKKLK